MRHLHFLFLVFLTGTPVLKAQVTFPTNGAPSPVHTVFALVHAHLVDDIREIKDGTLLVQDKVILAAGAGIAIPENAVIIDLKGKYIYPSFIELNSSYGMPSVSYERRQQPGPQMESSLKGAYGWNMALRTTLRAHELFRHDQEAADDWRKAGFGAVMTFAHDGIVRGSAAFVLLNSSRRIIPRASPALLLCFDRTFMTQIGMLCKKQKRNLIFHLPNLNSFRSWCHFLKRMIRPMCCELPD